MEVTVKNSQGDTVQTIDMNDAVFSVPMNHALVHQALVIYQGNRRQGTADTKTRAQVSGGGRKPWIQKHTGRARQGSTRSPQWRHGGVVFGPHPRDFRKALPRRMRQLALKCVLSEKIRQNQLICIDAMDGINGKTKTMVELLSNLGITGSALVVTKDTVTNVVRAAHNIEKIWTLPVNQLNAQELLSRDKLVITLEAARWAEQELAVAPSRWKDRMAGLSGSAPSEPATAIEEPVTAQAQTTGEEEAGGDE
ncbi:MAG: 50S ribosomal protein L4 [Chloroflexota bacterium]|nr:50S ribosomal protein L4 [Chloroflexota bacterium]